MPCDAPSVFLAKADGPAPRRRLAFVGRLAFVDRSLALALIVLCLPLLSLAVLAVVLTSAGPAFSTLTTVTSRGRVLKLRCLRTTYRADPERHLACAENAALWLTPVGRLLRWTRIDTLPALFSVCEGEMGLAEALGF